MNVRGTRYPADWFFALDDAGHIWTLAYVYMNGSVALYTIGDPEDTTLPELSYPGLSEYDTSMTSLVYSEEDGGDVIYVSYFDGETNQIYRLAYSVIENAGQETYFWNATQIGEDVYKRQLLYHERLLLLGRSRFSGAEA